MYGLAPIIVEALGISDQTSEIPLSLKSLIDDTDLSLQHVWLTVQSINSIDEIYMRIMQFTNY